MRDLLRGANIDDEADAARIEAQASVSSASPAGDSHRVVSLANLKVEVLRIRIYFLWDEVPMISLS